VPATKLKRFSVHNPDRNATLVTDGVLASSLWSRFWGLMFRKSVPEGGGLLLTRSASIHSFFMRFRFDAIFIDNDGRVVKVVHAMGPWRAALGGRGAKDTLELPAGVAERTGTVAGDRLEFSDPTG
jgi:uncharacterized membrane protein (UPF0127 family)